MRGSIAVLGANEPNCDQSCFVARGISKGSPEEEDLIQGDLQTGSNMSASEVVDRMRGLRGARAPLGSPAQRSRLRSGVSGKLPELAQRRGLRVDFLACTHTWAVPQHFDRESDLRDQAMRNILRVREQLEALHSKHGK